MAIAVKAEVKAIGFTKDEKKVALRFESEDDKPMIIEFPINGLEALGLLTAQVADVSAKRTGSPYQPHRLPVWKWEAGIVQEEDIVVLALHIEGGGAFGFRFDRRFALDLRDGIGEAIGLQTAHTHKPN